MKNRFATRREAALRQIAGIGPFIEGTLVKVAGKTRAVFAPLDRVEDVEAWTRECRRLKRPIRSVTRASLGELRSHVKSRRASAGGRKSPARPLLPGAGRVVRRRGRGPEVRDGPVPAADAAAARDVHVRRAQRGPGPPQRDAPRLGRTLADILGSGPDALPHLDSLTLSAVFQTGRDGDGNTLRFLAHLTLRSADRDNRLARAADGRLRWRCENEGFNTLKNGGFALEHVYSRNENASKCYVLLMLLAHIVRQLVARGRLGAAFDETLDTLKAYGKRMLAALLNIPPDPGRAPPGQIRLSTA